MEIPSRKVPRMLEDDGALTFKLHKQLKKMHD